MDNFTSKILSRASYMIPLALIYIVPCIISAGLFLIPESPRWLVQRGRPEKARKALEWLRPDQELVETELREIQVAVETENQLAQGAAWLDMFRNPVDLRRTMLSVASVSTQAACGAMYLIGRSIVLLFNELLVDNVQHMEHTSSRWLKLETLSKTHVSWWQ